jgi:hypothetical protein
MSSVESIRGFVFVKASKIENKTSCRKGEILKDMKERKVKV